MVKWLNSLFPNNLRFWDNNLLFYLFSPYINIHASKKEIKVYISSQNNNSGTKTIQNIIIW